MANKKKPSSSEDPKVQAQREKLRAQMEKERRKAAKKREKERAKQARDAERYEKQAAEARKKAAEARELREKQANDPAYQEKMRREQERLKEKGRKKIEKDRKKAAKRAAQAEKERKRIQNERINKGLASVPTGPATQRDAKQGKKPVNENAKRKRGSIVALVAILLITIASAIMLYPPQDRITMGLDIQGGVSVNLKAVTTDGSAPTSQQMSEAQQVISSRVNASGASAATVQQQGSDSFLVQVPGADNSQTILDTLGSQGVLEFARVDSITDETARGYVEQNITGMNLKEEGIGYTAFMTGDSVQQATVGRPQGSADYSVNLQLDGDGTREFGTVSTELVSDHGQIAIILDGVVKSAPHVQSAITTGQVQITGNYGAEEANALKAIIDSGSLPVSLEIQQSSVVGPILGQNALTVGIISAGIGLAFVIVWLLLFYNGLGLLTGVSIVIMSVVYLGLLALLSFVGWFSLTLPGIAGIIVNIGLSADSSILIMECFHEQIRSGKSFKTAAREGVHEGIFTSLDADGVTLVSALILYFVAIGDVKGFGLTLALGIICDLIIMALFSGPVIRLLGPGVIRRNPGFWGVADDAHEGEYLAHLNSLGAPGKVAEEASDEEKERLVAQREAQALERAEKARKAKAARRARAAQRSEAGKQADAAAEVVAEPVEGDDAQTAELAAGDAIATEDVQVIEAEVAVEPEQTVATEDAPQLEETQLSEEAEAPVTPEAQEAPAQPAVPYGMPPKAPEPKPGERGFSTEANADNGEVM